MRRVPALAVSLVLATAAAAGAAPARGVTFTDPAGDADGVDGRAGATSQAAYDVVRVRLAPYQRTAKTSGVSVALTLAALPSTSPGSSYFVSATQGACEITASRTATATDGFAESTLVTCGTLGGWEHRNYSAGLKASGKTITFTVPAGVLPNARVGAPLTNVRVGTAAGEPVSGTIAPAHVDTARYAKAYRVGS